MENDWRAKTTGGCADATGYPQEGTAPEPIDYRAKLADAAKGVPTPRYPNGGALTYDKQPPRNFETGATRNSDAGKPDYEGFISPLVMHRFGQYMNKHRRMENGSLRESDNWQKGIPRKQYLKSMLRHVMDVWLIMRDFAGQAVEWDLAEALCAVKFNVDGLLHEVLKGRDDSGCAKAQPKNFGVGGGLAGCGQGAVVGGLGVNY